MTTYSQSLPTENSAISRLIKRLPVVIQSEASECGLACLNMISGYHGYKTSLAQLRQRFPISSHGAEPETAYRNGNSTWIDQSSVETRTRRSATPSDTLYTPLGS